MIDPSKDGRLAARMREIAELEQDSSHLTPAGDPYMFSGTEKARVLNIAADVLEEYVLAVPHAPTEPLVHTTGYARPAWGVITADHGKPVPPSSQPPNFPMTRTAWARLRAAWTAYLRALREEKAAKLVLRAFQLDPTLPDAIADGVLRGARVKK